MHRAPTPTPDSEPFTDEDPVPVPGVPAPDDEQVPDHKPMISFCYQHRLPLHVRNKGQAPGSNLIQLG